jgi:glutaredoxin
MKMRFLMVLCCLAVAAAQAANVYRWVGADGKVHYSDTPPPAGSKNVEQKRVDGNLADDGALPYAVQQAVKKFPVTLYVTNCGEGCDKAREHLKRRGVPYAEKNPAENQTDREALNKLLGSVEVPTLVVGKSPTKGYEVGLWDAALDEAGYPKTNSLKRPAPAKSPAPAKPEAKPDSLP